MSDSDDAAREPAGLEGLPPMYSIAKGEVVSLQTYGAFVRLPGYKKEGGDKSSSFVTNINKAVTNNNKKHGIRGISYYIIL